MQIVAAPGEALSTLSSVEDFVFFDMIDEHLPQHLRQAMQVVANAAPQLVAFVNPQLFWERLDDFQEGLNSGDHTLKLAVGTVAIASVTLTAGYVFWTIECCGAFTSGC